MPPSMVERVARAIAEASMIQRVNYAQWGGVSGIIPPLDMAEIARAAIAAMREPTEAMLQYGGTALDHPNVYMGGASRLSLQRVPKVWDAMIDAALKEGE